MASVREFAAAQGFTPPISGRALVARYGVSSLGAALAASRIRKLHISSGGRFGPLGPVAEPVVPAPDGSYSQAFELGHARLQTVDSPAGAESDFQARVSLAALRCFGTQDKGTDETYAIVSVISLNPLGVGTDRLVATKRTQIQENVKPGDTLFKSALSFEDFAVPLTGSGVAIHVSIWDHESGDVDDITEAIHKVLNDAVNKGAQALAGGAEVEDDPKATSGTWGDITQWEIGGVKPINYLTLGIARGIAGLLADDLVGEHVYIIRAEQVKQWANQEALDKSWIRDNPELEGDVSYNWPPTPNLEALLTDGSGTYKAYFKIRGIAVTVPLEK